jgi:hypothetical protein
MNADDIEVFDPSNDPKKLSLKPVSGGELLAKIKPLHFVIEDILAKGYVYTLTARNNHGKSTLMALMTKCITEGAKFGSQRTERGRILILSGENTPDTLLKLKAIDIDPSMFDVVDGSYEMRANADDQLKNLAHEYAGIFVDSNQAYFGDGEMNGNSESLAHAQAFRRLTKAPGEPFVCILSHPTKNADEENLIPYGGGSFMNEIDGNITLNLQNGLAKLSHTKLRQPSFDGIDFKLQVHEFPELRNNFGKATTSTVFEAISSDQAFVEGHKEEMIRHRFLVEFQAKEKPSATDLGDKYFTNPIDPEKPNFDARKKRAQRIIQKLVEQKLLTKSLNLTKDGRNFINE